MRDVPRSVRIACLLATIAAVGPLPAAGAEAVDYSKVSVPEVFIYSSNIGAARMALMVGPIGQRAFMDKLGMLDRLATDLTSVSPVRRWARSPGPMTSPVHWAALADGAGR